MSDSFVLLTDDSCDLTREYLKNNSVGVIELSFHIDGQSYKGEDMTPQEFYSLIRQGKQPTTAQVNVDEMHNFFEGYLKEGKDILYIAFSSGLSGTCASGEIAAKELAEKYKDNKIIVVDTLCASMGQGVLVHKACKLRDAGMGLEELAKWCEDNKLKVAHYIMVEDLMHLHRGGRVSKSSALVGSMLGIKPLIYVNDEGKLVSYDKARGRKQAFNTMVEHIARCIEDLEDDTCMISHADCLEDAEYLAELVRSRYNVRDVFINYIGPVIGSHTGAGAVTVFMMAKRRYPQKGTHNA